MAGNIAFAGQLPADAFQPQPDPAKLPMTLVIVGIYIASSVMSWILKALPYLAVGTHLQYVFGIIVLIVIFGFGVSMIVTGWLIADNPTRYAGFGRTMLRASHVALVFAIALQNNKHWRSSNASRV